MQNSNANSRVSSPIVPLQRGKAVCVKNLHRTKTPTFAFDSAQAPGGISKRSTYPIFNSSTHQPINPSTLQLTK